VRDRVEVKTSRRRRVASSPAHGRHAAGAACRGRSRWRGERVRASARERIKMPKSGGELGFSKI
jgi:hypothetical protein